MTLGGHITFEVVLYLYIRKLNVWRFQGFKDSKKWITNMVDWAPKGFQTLRLISLLSVFCIYVIQLCGWCVFFFPNFPSTLSPRVYIYIFQKWKPKYDGVIVILIFKLSKSYHFWGNNIYTLCTLLDSVFHKVNGLKYGNQAKG